VAWEEALKIRSLLLSKYALWEVDRRQAVSYRRHCGRRCAFGRTRESMRDGNIVDAIEKGVSPSGKMFETKIQYLISGGMKGEAKAVALICPLISTQMSDSEQALGSRRRLMWKAPLKWSALPLPPRFGKWRDDRNILLTQNKRVDVQSSKEHSCDARWRKSKFRPERGDRFVL